MPDRPSSSGRDQNPTIRPHMIVYHDFLTAGNLLKPSRAARPSEPCSGGVKAQPAQQAWSRSDRMQGARSAGTAVYMRVHEEFRAPRNAAIGGSAEHTSELQSLRRH